MKFMAELQTGEVAFVFRNDQIELVMDVLKYTKEMLDTGTVLSEAHKMAGRFVYRRINEVLESMTEQCKSLEDAEAELKP